MQLFKVTPEEISISFTFHIYFRISPSCKKPKTPKGDKLTLKMKNAIVYQQFNDKDASGVVDDPKRGALFPPNKNIWCLFVVITVNIHISFIGIAYKMRNVFFLAIFTNFF